MNFDPYRYQYPSRRNVVYGSKGMVATSHPLAAQAGLEILKKGGNAIDAAIAAAAALTVVEPTSNGLGSDNFAIIWKDGKLHGINGSGRAPLSFDLDKFRGRGWEKVPEQGWPSATVPAAPKTWAVLAETMGNLPLTETLAPAISYARDGHAVGVTVAHNWRLAFEKYSRILKGREFEVWFNTFCPEGRSPRAGELWRCLDQAYTLELIAKTNAESFYAGEIAEKIIAFSNRTGGFYSQEDFEQHNPEWVDPISVNYKGYDIWEIPPNGQGIIVLMALNMLKGFNFTFRNAETFHAQIEAIKLAFADAHRYVADQRFSQVPVAEMLSDNYGDVRRACIKERACLPKAGEPEASGTVYLSAADSEGNMVSFIQSNYAGFGSAIVIPKTGIALNNRAKGFSLDPNHPNVLAPGKRPYHTIIPGFITKDGEPVGPFGVMGGYMQPQGHVQVIMNMVDFAMNPQEAIDAPRWQWVGDMNVSVEPGFPIAEAQALARMGHHMGAALDSNEFGRGQMILRTSDGTLVGAISFSASRFELWEAKTAGVA
jgi:gamma-glutamyltranspeptidase/glutathione hydrolase